MVNNLRGRDISVDFRGPDEVDALRKKRRILRECAKNMAQNATDETVKAGPARYQDKLPKNSLVVSVGRHEHDEFGSREIEILAVDVSGVESCCRCFG